MVGKTHLTAGAIFIAEAGLGGLLPDIDKKNSTINKVTKPIGFVTETVIGHRRLFHNPLFYIALGMLAWFFAPTYMAYVAPVLLGVATHLVLDALNPTGIPILGFRVHMSNVHTGSSGDKFLGAMLRIIFRIEVVIWVIRYLLTTFTGGI